MFWFVFMLPDGDSVNHPHPLEGIDAVKLVVVEALTFNVCELEAALLNDSDDGFNVRAPVVLLLPLTRTTTGTTTLPFAEPLALIVIVPVFVPFARDDGFRCTTKLP